MVKRSVPTPTSHRVVEHNGILYLGGIGAPNRGEGEGMLSQARQVFARIESLLKEAGSDKTKLLTATIYIADHDLKSEMDQAWNEWLDDADKPTRATIAVGDMGSNILIEAVTAAIA
jgi:enamine deaminase RidA (YjgF/YER057c/UK114 family)